MKFIKRNAKKIRCSFLFFIIVLLVSFGCSPKIITPKEAFFRNNPDLLSEFKRFDEISPGAQRLLLKEEKSTVNAILKSIQNRFSDNMQLLKFIEIMKNRYSESFKDRIAKINQIAINDMTEGDSMYLFEYENDKKSEFGIIILRDGEIKKKIIEGGRDKIKNKESKRMIIKRRK